MCGIAGFYSLVKSLNEESLKILIEKLRHRGPDNLGYFQQERVCLGHSRLSILDLSEDANQPMFSKNGRFVIIYNGEVYNFRELANELNSNLKTTSDTEVILDAFQKWGVDFVHKLNGMFAFAIYDKELREMYIYRDRMGIKPLYYFWDGTTFLFASELKALTSLSLIKEKLSINKQAVTNFLNLGYIPRPLTIFNEINKMDSGTYFLINEKGLSKNKYWKLEKKIEKTTIKDFSIAKSTLKELVLESVRYRMISDVPFGTFLSGGIDSSLVTAAAQSLSNTSINTFSIGFDKAKFNEANYAKAVAKHLKTNHHEFTVTYNDAMELVTQLTDIYDEPFADSSAIPTLMVSALARKHVKMTLSGDGGDELFLGYGMYQWAKRLNNPLIKAFRKPISTILSKINNRYERASLLFEYKNSEDLKSHIFSQEQYYFSKQEIKKLLNEQYKTDVEENKYLPMNRQLHVMEEQALFDLNYYLQDDLLVKVDRASMHHSLETRVPLLDYRIVEFALNLDVKLKVKDGTSKYLLKEVLYDLVPKNLFNRPKWGFSIPLANWLKKDLKYLIDNYLSKPIVEKHFIVNYAYVDSLKKSFFSGKDFLYNRIWLLIVLHIWLEKNNK